MKERIGPELRPVPGPAGSTGAAGESRRAPDLDGLLESLLRIGHDRDQLKAYLAKLDEVGADRDPIVTSRLREEYESRLRAVREEAEPIVADIRELVRTVSRTKDKFRRALEGARLDKEERELRRAVGELGGDELERQIAEADAKIADAQRRLAETDDRVKLLEQGLQDYLEGEPEESLPEVASQTDPAPAVPDATVIAPKASLRTSEGTEFHVGRFALIGGEDCHIALDGFPESGAHASIKYTDEGFVLRSENPEADTRVNGEPVVTRALQNGDSVAIGAFDLEFCC